MRILISNPSKQYTHHTVKALAGKYEVFFATAFWHHPEQGIGKWLSKIGWLQKHLAKKTDTSLDTKYILTHWTGIVYKFIGRFFIRDVERWSFIEDRIHDRWVSKTVKKIEPTIVIGYEKSCILTFKVAQQYGIKTILDLSQVHVAFIENLRNEYPFFAAISGAEKLFKQIKEIKTAEYDLAGHIITLSAFAKKTLTDNAIVPEKISIAPLGFDETVFKPRVNKIKGKHLELIYVGIITYRKGIQLLLKLMEELEKQPVHLTIIGPRGDADELLNNKKNNSNITYIPYLTHNHLVELLQRANVFILPSYLDSWAAVVIEAMACGLPVIVTENTGAKEAVNVDNGFVLKVNDSKALKNAVNFFLENNTAVEQMGKAAAISAKQYVWENYYKIIQQIIQNQ